MTRSAPEPVLEKRRGRRRSRSRSRGQPERGDRALSARWRSPRDAPASEKLLRFAGQPTALRSALRRSSARQNRIPAHSAAPHVSRLRKKQSEWSGSRAPPERYARDDQPHRLGIVQAAEIADAPLLTAASSMHRPEGRGGQRRRAVRVRAEDSIEPIQYRSRAEAGPRVMANVLASTAKDAPGSRR